MWPLNVSGSRSATTRAAICAMARVRLARDIDPVLSADGDDRRLAPLVDGDAQPVAAQQLSPVVGGGRGDFLDVFAALQLQQELLEVGQEFRRVVGRSIRLRGVRGTATRDRSSVRRTARSRGAPRGASGRWKISTTPTHSSPICRAATITRKFAGTLAEVAGSSGARQAACPVLSVSLSSRSLRLVARGLSRMPVSENRSS